jgi:uncharacterized protein YdeI (YjbR/CyaY-like superfamily)
MRNRDPRVDAYIAKSPAFAKPILATVREAVHAALPEVEETMKWSTPFFDYKGPICMVAAFKEHCRFGFWKGSLVTGRTSGEKMERITSVTELPSKKTLVALVKKAARLNEEGVKLPRAKRSLAKKPAVVPGDLAAALKKNKKANAAFAKFSPSQRLEYIDWITGAKAAETRERRLLQGIEWIAEGKPRNWKYMKK